MRNTLLAGAALAALTPTVVYAQSDSAPAPQPARENSAHREIIVTASPYAVFQDSTAAIVAKVDRGQIVENGGASIANALSNVPGVAATGFAAGASRPIIRGMDANRVRLLENGTSASDVSDIGPDHGVPIDPLSARSIEVVRGAGTLRYGSQAIGGVVNVLNDRVPMTLPDKPIGVELNGNYDTVSNAPEASALIDTAVNNFALHADGFYRHADDYDTPVTESTPDGKLDNSFAHAHGGSLGGSYFFGGSHMGVGVTQYDATYGIPAEDAHIDMKQTKVMTRSSFDLGGDRKLTLDGSYANYKHSEVEADGEIATTFRNKEWDVHPELLLGALGPLTNVAIGGEYIHRKFSAVGEDASYLFPTLTESEAGYIFTDMPLGDSVNLQASGRIEHVSVEGTPVSDVFTKASFTPVSGAIGALWTATPALKLGLTFSSTGRAPAQTELFARGGHDGPQTFEFGDPTLGIERANSLEASVRFDQGQFHFDGSLYSTWFNDYIYGDLTGRTCDDDGVCVAGDANELKELFYRQQNAHFRGLEGEAFFDMVQSDSGTLQLHVLGDYVRATFDNDGGNVPRIPPYRIGGGVKWKGDSLDAGMDLTYFGKQDKFGAYDTPTDSYYNLNARIAWRPFEQNQGVEFAVVGQNLTNDVQRDAAALNRSEVIMPGRNVRFVVRMAM
ncbi:TonB-dependent receptor [Altericroceibacterium endophyticum]|uniref:TonB-dependent receptor n=1 Tax=Altericroceibacterium endophyticum TaxID=1808508 RepID=A0A6I4T6U8_9SPHN|nr:TonB-dependent receptor [Altericroceibacterium endophyticum]MXO66199.1 TonB-dependent receptor [Altericroceibacterium endophyticum]